MNMRHTFVAYNDNRWTRSILNFERFELSCQLSLYGGKQEDEKKAVYLQRDLEKAVMICKVLSLGCWCPPSFCKQQRISHCTGYTRLFDVNFTTKVTHSRTYLQSNKIAEKKSILNFGFTSPLRPSKDRTVVTDGAALATSSQLNHDTSLQFFDILQ